MLISEEEENAIGKEAAPQVERELGGIYHNRELTQYVDEVGQKLTRVCHRAQLKYKFQILNSPVPNAMSIPGGYIYITRGLLFRLQNEAQLAGVLGHEVGHITARHAAAMLSQAMGFNLLTNIARVLAAGTSQTEGGERGQAAGILAQITSALVLLKYSREDEYQADSLGAEYSYKAGYDPRGMVEVLYILKELEGRHKGAKVPEYFSSHPRTKDRIKEQEGEIDKKYPNKIGLVKQGEFKTHIQKFWALEKTLDSYDQAKQEAGENEIDSALLLINKAIEQDPNQAAYYVERAKIYEKKKWYPKAREDFKTARNLDPKNYDALLGYGVELFRARDFNSAEGELERAVSLLASDPVSWYFFAETKYMLSKNTEAVRGYEMVIKLTEKKPIEPYTSNSQKRLHQLKK
jgi:predicted Zn-dependent protease